MEADQHLKEQLSQYPSSFSIEIDMSTLKPKYLEQKICDIKNEMEDFETPMEKCRALNLLSFLYYLIGDTQSALQYNDRSIEEYTENITGLCNRGRFLVEEGRKYKEVRDLCAKLQEVSKEPLKMIIAKAEIAYTYARLGIQFYKTASDIYQEVILEAKEYVKSCFPQSIELEENICVWSFGCALAQVRLFNTFNVCRDSDLEVTRACVVSASELSAYIIKSNFKSSTLEALKPRAYVLLGTIAKHIRWRKNLFPNQFADILPKDQDLHMSTDDYFDKALEHQNKDTFVLGHCGKHFKTIKKTNKAIEVFRRAIESGPSSLSYHHLALALKDQLVQSIKRKPYSRQPFSESDRVAESRPDPQDFSTTRGLEYQNVPSISTEKHTGKSSQRYDTTEPKQWQTHKTTSRTLNAPTKDKPGSLYSSKRGEIDKKLFKNPQKLLNINYSTHKEVVDEIIYHLEKALELGMNTSASYDKGLLLRQTGRVHEAIDTFMHIIKDKQQKTSLVVLANAYEQVGYCWQEILETNRSSDRESDKEEMIMAFKKSLELSCKIVAKVPELKNCWNTAPTLKTFLMGQANTKENLKDLSFLYEKLQAYSEHIDILQELLFMSETHSEQIQICLKIQNVVENYLKIHKFDDAVLLLDILMFLPDWPTFMNEDLFIKANIEGAYYVFRHGDKTVAKMRFNNALQFRRLKQALAIGASYSTDETKHAILILCDPKRVDNGYKLQQIFEYLGVKATLNFNDVLRLGRLKSKLLVEVIPKSNHFLVIYDFDQTTDGNDAELMSYVDIMVRLVKERKHGHILTLVSSSTSQSNVPKTLPDQLIFDFGCIENKEIGFDLVKGLLIRLA